MADTTKIEWTDATWNPITGCTVHSAGCTNCYAMQLAGTRLKHHPSRKGLTREVNGNHVWTGEVKFNGEWLTQPLQWKRPRDIFVCAHADLFHEKVPDEWIDKIFAVMALAPQHRFQVLTKRSDRMRAYLTLSARRLLGIAGQVGTIAGSAKLSLHAGQEAAMRVDALPLPNVWLGVSVENQRAADERIPDLLATTAAIRWLSCEPLLGPVQLDNLPVPTGMPLCDCRDHRPTFDALNGTVYCAGCCEGPERLSTALDWIVCGGESGRNARPMHPDWARSLRDQCAEARVPFHFKQWGEWAPCDVEDGDGDTFRCFVADGTDRDVLPETQFQSIGDQNFARVGKKAAGRLLDGVQHDGVPA